MTIFPESDKAYLTPNEVAELLMVSPVTVRSWAKKGLLTAMVTPGGHRRFLKSDVERFVRESAVGQAGVKSSALRVLIVDDDPVMSTYLSDILENSGRDFVIGVAQNGFEAGSKIRTFSPDVVLLDLLLPDIDGFLLCALIKGDATTQKIRVIAISGDASVENVSRILEAGAETFLAKPFKPQDLLEVLGAPASVQKNLPGALPDSPDGRLQQDDELTTAEAILYSLARMAEAKNGFAGNNSSRLSAIVDIFSRTLGVGTEEYLALRRACVLHDIGNLGIPDNILLKPAPLTEEEWRVMRTHTLIGARLCSKMKNMELTMSIIRSHHERWDGSGYPDGLKGEDIPYLARVFQFADIFEAVSSRRPYKPAFSFEETVNTLRQEIVMGRLDPNLGAIFMDLLTTRPQDFVATKEISGDGASSTQRDGAIEQ